MLSTLRGFLIIQLWVFRPIEFYLKAKNMRTIGILIFSLIFSNLWAQNIVKKEVETDVKEAVVFLDGAQVLRQENIELSKGITIVKFVNLSPFIDVKSIQVKTKGQVTVLSVKHQQNYLNKSVKSEELSQLGNKLELIRSKITLENTYISVIKEVLAFLEDNREIGGKNQQLSLSNLQQTADYYSKKLTSLKLKEVERKATLAKLYKQQNDIRNQMRNLSNEKEYPTGEVWVKVDAKSSESYAMELTYLVNNVSWFPTYDIRARSINEPIKLIYKANVTQNTRVDWENVRLTFSTADPNVSGVAPILQPYYLNYNSLPPTYKNKVNSISGRVTDSDGEVLPGTSIVIKGTTIGTASDMDGKYNLTLPSNASHLVYSFVGFKAKTLPISSEHMNVILEEDNSALNEVVVTGFTGKSKYLEMVDDDMEMEEMIPITRQELNSPPIPLEQVENRTSVNFEIMTPYSIKSENKKFTLDMDSYELSAFYEYHCIPKIEKDAFLLANIVNWEKYNLLDGEANVFFEDTYIGKTLLDLRYASDTLQISLGRDKKVVVEREKIKDFSKKRLLGKKKEETLVWKTTVKNNKNQEIKMILIDQVPVSTLDEIEVNVLEQTGAKYNTESGMIKWEFKLKPSDKKELKLRYLVKYPKYRRLVIE